MAKETTIRQTVSYTKNGALLSLTVSNTSDQTGEAAIQNVQIVGTTSEAINLGDVTDPAVVSFKNLDTTNPVYIDNATATTSSPIKLTPGQGVVIPTASATWHAIATGASVNLACLAIQR